jgi:hypothetical protein
LVNKRFNLVFSPFLYTDLYVAVQNLEPARKFASSPHLASTKRLTVIRADGPSPDDWADVHSLAQAMLKRMPLLRAFV